MTKLPHIFANNRQWVAHIRKADPNFFSALVAQQTPDYLWIGCSDSRVPANEIVGLLPGELFVHRNVANLVIHADLNCLSVLQYAIDILKVRHVIVCGHYGCGGVKAAMEDQPHGLVDNWLRPVRDIYQQNRAILDNMSNTTQMLRSLCEINVITQVINVGNTTIVQDAWMHGQNIVIHGWIYDISDGLLNDLSVCIASNQELYALQQRRLQLRTQ